MSFPEFWSKEWWAKRELGAIKEKLMDHQSKTVMEALGVAVGVASVDFIKENLTLLFDGNPSNRKHFLIGLISTGLGAAVIYFKARYATPPDVKQQIAEGTFPQRRDESTRQERKE